VKRGHYLDARTGSTEHPSLVSDPIPEFIYKKMGRQWALRFSEGSVKIGSLFYYRTIKDESGMIVDPHEGLEEAEVTGELEAEPMLAMIAKGNLPPAGSRLRTEAPVRPFYELLEHALGLHDRWFTKRTKFQAQGEVRVGWIPDPIVCFNPIPPLAVAGLQDFVKVLD
jgi:hypothetical protein